ncbi:uncharacterized protein LOC129723417 [Wyeomyia smithii]|uniref:uncharacterized protein LOC129723417 n=1 Tax=Wyeomyia smithii TaxID=174621 RepID=UPI00246819EB|nr:uncharacterized protein LOC129723417 [Wyeomyia smithii]XP_055533598.1 uncharacterized protein LOC129723417 [Wyeomyia smithii]XP_055533599.1 uncharacterized protein LOC129723417 [Wyeomyia smithii]
MNIKMFQVSIIQSYIVALLLASVNAAEEKWSWSKSGATDVVSSNSNNNNLNHRNPGKLNVRSDVIEFQEPKRFNDAASTHSNRNQDIRQGRYEVKESSTRRPNSNRPLSDEFSGEVNGNRPEDFGTNQRFGGSYGGAGYPGNPYGGNPAFGGGNPAFGGGNPFIGGPGGIGFQRPGYGGGYGGGGFVGGGYGGGYGAANGILVGPEGPTGIIGRPYHGLNGAGYPNTGYGQYGHNFPGNYGGYGNPLYGNQGGFGRPGGFYPQTGIGGYPGGGFYGSQSPYGPGQLGPAQFGAGQFGPGLGARPGGLGPVGGPFGGGGFGPQFDQAKQSTKKIEKKSV